MKSGVSYPSYAADATYSMVSGSTADASFPVQNLADLYNVRTVFKAGASGASAFTLVFSATRALQFLGLVHHNGPAAATVRYRLFSDTNPDPVGNSAHMVLDTGALTLQTSSLFSQTFPAKLAAATSARSLRVDLSSNPVAWIVGALELAGWWEWTDVAVARELGIASNDAVVQQPFNVDHTMSSFGPRTWAGVRNFADQSESASTFQDFQLATKTAKPFVFCWDISDSTTYARECFLARNNGLTPASMNDYPGSAQSFNFLEHVR